MRELKDAIKHLHEHPKMQHHRQIPIDHVVIDRDVYDTLRKELPKMQETVEGVEAGILDYLESLKANHTKVTQANKEKADKFDALRQVISDGEERNYWIWVGDGYDHPESLTCSVLISAEKFRNILGGAEKWDKLIEESKGACLQEPGTPCGMCPEVWKYKKQLKEEGKS